MLNTWLLKPALRWCWSCPWSWGFLRTAAAAPRERPSVPAAAGPSEWSSGSLWEALRCTPEHRNGELSLMAQSLPSYLRYSSEPCKYIQTEKFTTLLHLSFTETAHMSTKQSFNHFSKEKDKHHHSVLSYYTLLWLNSVPVPKRTMLLGGTIGAQMRSCVIMDPV